jgi:hypothetical protein
MSGVTTERDNPGVIMLPPLILLIAIAVSAVLEWLVPLAFLPVPGVASWSSWLGAVLFVAGTSSTILRSCAPMSGSA